MILAHKDDKIVLLLDAGHAEYSIPDIRGSRYFEPVSAQYINMEDDDDQPIEKNLKLARELAKSPHNWLDPNNDDDLRWTTIVRVRGRIYSHAKAFMYLAADLSPSLDPAGYTPGGDDDYYDYYPSGLRLLREWAIDLDALVPKDSFYSEPGFLGVYHNVLRDFLRREKARFVPFSHKRDDGTVYAPAWHEMEEVEERINELAADLNKGRAAIIEQIP